MRIAPNAWTPTAGIQLEPNADEVVRSRATYLVTAGPGAGKTELLAQRASFLLETNCCPDPRRILAISFKRDSADNLRTRVDTRIAPGLAQRLDSHTFDSFAISLLDRFREALHEKLRPPGDYDIAQNQAEAKTLASGVVKDKIAEFVRNQPEFVGVRSLDPFWVLDKLLCRYPLPSFDTDPGLGELSKYIWIALIDHRPCILTYGMVKRLAQFIIARNPILGRALQTTYSHVFLDEFQDTTFIQYDLLTTCFPKDTTILTAVGDNKQRIMLWADAIPEAFARYSAEYDALSTQLLINWRSDRRLVEIQRFLIEAIDPDCQPSVPAPSHMAGDGVCEILEFQDEQHEAHHLLAQIRDLLDNGIPPREICILVRQTAPKYLHRLFATLGSAGINCRLEEPYQVLLKDELVATFLGLLHLALGVRPADYWQDSLEVLGMLEGSDPADEDRIALHEESLASFTGELRQKLDETDHSRTHVESIVLALVTFLEPRRIKAHFPKVQSGAALRRLLKEFAGLLFECLQPDRDWESALASFAGKDSIPAMTIHKSKGLEYHAVFFIGLEDSAWWNFAKQSEEETCAFFVAFSRAKKQVCFTFCRSRQVGAGTRRLVQKRLGVNSLYRLLMDAGVDFWSIEPDAAV